MSSHVEFSPDRRTHVIVIGGGVIGLAVAWRLLRRGLDVRVLERGRCGREASWTAAGMLGVDAEMEFERPELHRFCVKARQLWPSFAEELEVAADRSLDYRIEPTLLVAENPDARKALRRRFEFLRAHTDRVEWLTGSEARRVEPFLSPGVCAAVRAAADHQIDNRALVRALVRAIDREGGVREERTEVERIERRDDGVRVHRSDGPASPAEWAVLAAGAWSGRIDGLPDPSPPIRPVRGQVIELEREEAFGLDHVVRGSEAYLVPKREGRLTVGATEEERGFDRTVTAGAVRRLLEGARDAVRGVDELPVRDVSVGFRPASRDHRPVLGPPGDARVVYATGHHRHGILLSAITAREVARFVAEGTVGRWLRTFSPNRFSSVSC